MPHRFTDRPRPARIVREFAEGNVRVEVNPDLLFVIIANGYALPGDVGPAQDFAELFTGGRDKVLAVNAEDDVTGDRDAIVLIYANAVGMAGLIPVP